MREREKDEESMRMGKDRKSPGKTDVPKLYTYNECELCVEGRKIKRIDHLIIEIKLLFSKISNEV